ncbi:MAG: hypothetical protein MHM6MM_001378 [Cercozoa sp. M6MM]
MLEMLDRHTDDFKDALALDLSRPRPESFLTELGVLRNEVAIMLDRLDDWMKPRKDTEKELVNQLDEVLVLPSPLGVIAVIASWCAPVLLTLLPVATAVAAGNCVILKPSEVAGSTAKLLERLLPQYLDQDAVSVVQGGAEQAIHLAAESSLGKIVFSGRAETGKHIARAAAANLTPVVLQCGGKSPAVVHTLKYILRCEVALRKADVQAHVKVTLCLCMCMCVCMCVCVCMYVCI